MNSNQDNPLNQNFTFLSLIKFAFPTIIMMIFMGFYTITDTIFVSHFINTNALSAINIICPITNIIVGFATMIATGSSSIIAHYMGNQQHQKANQTFTLIFIFATIISSITTILSMIFIKNIISFLGASTLLFPYCFDYLSVLLLFTPACMIQVLFQNLIITAGKPVFGLLLSISSGFVNIILDYLFIVPFDMGIKGSALATGIGYLLPTIIGFIFFIKKKGTFSFQKPHLDISVLIKSCTNGSSEMVSQLATAITTFFFNSLMMKYRGEDGVAAMTFMIYTQFLLTSFYIGFSMGVAPIVSFHDGAQNHSQLKKIFCMCITLIGLSSLSIFIFTLLFYPSLIILFTSAQSTVYQLAYEGFSIFIYSFLFSGFNILSSAFFTALSNGKISALISFLRTFGFLMINLFIFPIIWNIKGIWFAVPAAEFFTFIISLILIIKYKEKYHYW